MKRYVVSGVGRQRDSSDGLEGDLVDSITLLNEERLALLDGNGVQEGGE